MSGAGRVVLSKEPIMCSAKYVRCSCGAGCDDYDHRETNGGCAGKVLVHDPDDVCPRHECERHARPPKVERISQAKEPHT